MPSRSKASTPPNWSFVISCLSLTALMLAAVACTGPGFAGGDWGVREKVSGDWIRVYFTNPQRSQDERLHSGGLDQDLVFVIEQAETSVDVAAYDLDLESIAYGLIAAHDRGVQVRLVTESDNADRETLIGLQEAGISVFEDENDSGVMHDKFAVIDRQWVWTGSWNLTDNGTYRNNNNAVLLASTALAGNYTAEFEEMVAGQFGATSPADTPNPRVIITAETRGGQRRRAQVENYFAPEDQVAGEIIAEIEAAQDRIRFLAFVFTSEAIVDAMLERSQAGVVVQGVVEERNADQPHSQYDRLRAALHDILTDGNPYIMHHKAIIIDDATVILGSYNFTRSAEERNDENVIIIHDPEVAELFVDEFGRVYEQARRAGR